MEHLRSPALASASASASIPWSSLSPPTSLDTEALPLSRKRLASPPSPHEVIGDIIRLCPSASETLSGVRDRTSYKNLVKNANNTGRKVEGQVAHHLASMLEASIESQEGMEMLDMPVQIGLDQPISKFVAAGTGM